MLVIGLNPTCQAYSRFSERSESGRSLPLSAAAPAGRHGSSSRSQGAGSAEPPPPSLPTLLQQVFLLLRRAPMDSTCTA